MKKILSILLVLCMVFVMCACGDDATSQSAAQTEQAASDVADVKENAEPYEGHFVEVCGALNLYMPSDWLDYSDSVEASEDDLIYITAEVGNVDNNQLMDFGYIDAKKVTSELGVSTLEELQAQLVEDDYKDVIISTSTDGFAYLRCDVADKYNADCTTVYIPDADGGLYVLMLFPASNAELKTIVDYMLSTMTAV